MSDNLLEQINPVLLLGPGPSPVSPVVYKAISSPTLGHLDPYFIKIMDTVKEQLRTVMCTRNELTIPMSGTGSAGMETCLVNLIEPGDSVLVLVNGVFGQRMLDAAQRAGAKVTALEFEWGTPIVPETVKAHLKNHKYAFIGIVHAETSTGVLNPAEEIGNLAAEHGALYIVDCVTSLGGLPTPVDNWKADAVYSGTQKCLSCPPGLSPVSFSSRATAKILGRKNKVTSWYLDLSMIINYWQGNTRAYHHTAPVNMVYALYSALHELLREGLENSFKRHQEAHKLLVKHVDALGLKMYVEPDSRLPMLNAIACPEGVDEARIRRRLLDEFRIEIGAGLGPLAGKIWRVGLMGHGARTENVETLMEALKKCLD